MLEFLKFYNRPQTYKAEIRVEVENRSNKKAKGHLVVPLPRTTEYQTTTPEFREPTMAFDLELEAGEKKSVSVVFKAHVMPRKYNGKIAPEIVQANEFVISYLTYGNAIDGLYTAQEAREKRVVDCGGFDTLLQDELKKKGIASNVVAGFWSDGKMHAWLEIEGNISADPSMEWLRARRKTKKSGKLGFVGSDRIVFSMGEPFLQKPITDLPHENHLYITRA
ncbi:MAG: hypothetical protein AAB420_01385 [Patescibacteria group bacterium]